MIIYSTIVLLQMQNAHIIYIKLYNTTIDFISILQYHKIRYQYYYLHDSIIILNNKWKKKVTQ